MKKPEAKTKSVKPHPRPTKRTPEAADIIAQSLELGLSRKDACIAASISEDTFALWLADDSDFSDKVAKSEYKCKQRNLGIIQKAAINNWNAAAWSLERKYPDEFSLIRKQEIDAKGLADAIVSQLMTVIRKNVPEFCPHCNNHLELKNEIARELSKLSETLAV